MAASRPLPEPTLRARSPQDLLPLVPYLLGFEPSDSTVIIGLSAGRLVTVTARVDIRAGAHRPSRRHACRVVARSGCDRVLLIGYPPRTNRPAEPTDAAGLPRSPIGRRNVLSVDAWTSEFARLGLLVVEGYVCDGDRWWHHRCWVDGQSCPACGQACQPRATLLAGAVAAGMSALPDRSSVEESLAPLPAELAVPSDRGGASAADLERADEVWLETLDRRVRSAHRGGATPGWVAAADAGLLVEALTDVGFRDRCVLGVEAPGEAGRKDAIRAVAARDLTRELARRSRGTACVAPYTLFAWFAWRSGDGTRAQIAVDIALENDPGYPLAGLLRDALTHGVRPEGDIL